MRLPVSRDQNHYMADFRPHPSTSLTHSPIEEGKRGADTPRPTTKTKDRICGLLFISVLFHRFFDGDRDGDRCADHGVVAHAYQAHHLCMKPCKTGNSAFYDITLYYTKNQKKFLENPLTNNKKYGIIIMPNKFHIAVDGIFFLFFRG